MLMTHQPNLQQEEQEATADQPVQVEQVVLGQQEQEGQEEVDGKEPPFQPLQPEN